MPLNTRREMQHRQGTTTNGQSRYKNQTINNPHSVGDRMGSGFDRVGNPTQGQPNQGLGSGSSFYWGNDVLGMAIATGLEQMTFAWHA